MRQTLARWRARRVKRNVYAQIDRCPDCGLEMSVHSLFGHRRSRYA